VKALQLTALNGPSSLILREIEGAPQLNAIFAGHKRILIEVHAAGVSFPELLQSYGRYQQQDELPFTPGGEVAGIVLDAPADAAVQVGDRVCAFTQSGGFAEVVAAPAMLAFPLHPSLSFAEGAALIMNYHTAYFCLVTRGHLEAGEWVAVHGAAGGVGAATIQVAKGLGAHVIAIVSNAEKAAVAHAMGADVVVRSTDAWKDEVIAASDGGVDMVIDPVGGDRAIDIMRTLREGGRWVIAGFAAGSIPQVKVNRLLLKNITAVGAGWGAYAFSKPELCASIQRELTHLIDAGSVKPLVGARFPIERGADALAHLEKRMAVGKVVIEVRSTNL
jgi:NADPH2:quinone reductase